MSSPLEIRGLLQKYSNYMHLVIWDGALSVNFTFGCYSFRCGNNQNENQCRKNHCFGKPQILCALPLQYIQDPSIFPGRHNMRAWPLCTSWRVVLRGCIPKCVFNGISSPNARTGQAVCFWWSVVFSASTCRAFWFRETCSVFGLSILTAQCVSSVTPSDSTAKSGLDLVDVHTMPNKATTSAAATDMGPQTRSRSVQNTVGKVPLTAEQEERLTIDANSQPMTMMTMPTTVISMTLSAKSSALHLGSHLLSTLISLLAPSTATSTSLALTFSLPLPLSPLPSPLLLLLLLLGSPSEIQEFSLYCNHLFPLESQDQFFFELVWKASQCDFDKEEGFCFKMSDRKIHSYPWNDLCTAKLQEVIQSRLDAFDSKVGSQARTQSTNQNATLSSNGSDRGKSLWGHCCGKSAAMCESRVNTVGKIHHHAQRTESK